MRPRRRTYAEPLALLLPDRFTNIALEDCVEMLPPAEAPPPVLPPAPPLPAPLPPPPLCAFPAVQQTAPERTPHGVVSSWADGLARAAHATAAALRAATSSVRGPAPPLPPVASLAPASASSSAALPRAAPSQCHGMRHVPAFRSALAAAAGAPLSSTSPAALPPPPPARRASACASASISPSADHADDADNAPASPSAATPMALSPSFLTDDLLAAVHGATLKSGRRKRSRTATTGACALPLAGGYSPPLFSGGALPPMAEASAEGVGADAPMFPPDEPPPPLQRVDVDAMLGAAVAASFGVEGVPAEAGLAAPPGGGGGGSAPPAPPSGAWMGGALRLGGQPLASAAVA
jgi:hypothetical protein